jgi:hypothetical protein
MRAHAATERSPCRSGSKSLQLPHFLLLGPGKWRAFPLGLIEKTCAESYHSSCETQYPTVDSFTNKKRENSQQTVRFMEWMKFRGLSCLLARGG